MITPYPLLDMSHYRRGPLVDDFIDEKIRDSLTG